jgi:plasmid segregation protein ParM
LEQVVQEILQHRSIQGAAVTVVPQPFGSFFDQILSPEGIVRDEQRALVHLGLIDIGYFTTDLAEVKELEFVQKGSGSLEVGVATVLDTVRRHAAEHWGRQLDLRECEQALHEQKLKVKGQEYGIHTVCDSALREAAAAIAAYAHQLWGGGEALDELLMTGGGGAVFHKPLRAEFSQLCLTSAPFLANARGFMRYALYKRRTAA